VHVRQVIPRDAIPSIDDPAFGREYLGDDDEEVIVLASPAGSVSDDADEQHGGTDGGAPRVRAYPIRILNYHEIVNDVVDGVPVAVTWCPLCGSAVVYDRRVDGETLTFGVSGKLAADDLVMYDRETGSEWKQSLGRCIAGTHEGRSLDVLAAPVVTWERFRREYPEGVVLQPAEAKSEAASDTDDPAEVDYALEPYEAYFEAEEFGLGAHRGTGGRTWDRTDLDPKTVVLGVEHAAADGSVDVLGFPLPRVHEAGGVATARVGTADVVVFASAEGIHGFEHPGYDFDAATADDLPTAGEAGRPQPVADGTAWDPVTGESEDGRRLERLPARRLFAFAWQDDHGSDAFWSP
jgi:hypothetical protein